MLLIVRVILMLLYFMLVSFVGTIYCCCRPFHPNSTSLFGRLFSWGGHRIMGIRINVKGMDTFDGLGPCVIVANHQDNLDLFALGHVVPPRCVSVGKKNLKYIPFFGQLYWLSGNVLIDRSNKQAAWESVQQTTHALKEKRMKIWVFPEGTRNKSKQLLPFKQGAFKMAMEAGVPVVPVCVNRYLDKMQLNNWHGGHIEVQVLPPVETKDMSPGDISELISSVRASMQECIDNMDG